MEPGWALPSVRIEALGPAGITLAGNGTYRGTVEVRRNGGAVAVVNHLALEDYVRGIDEVPPSWPAAALQAQAIAARTYAANTALSGDARWQAVGADICATSTCQVYRGLDAEARAEGLGWLPAVEATAGRALLAGGRPIRASYSSTANGPLAMSQNGALAMANEGRTAGDILQTYYGVRPTLAPDRLPAGIRVALATSAASARISSAGGLLRIVDAAGVELARSAGEWRFVAGGRGIQVFPPASWTSASTAAPAPLPAVPPVPDQPQPGPVLAVTPPRRAPVWPAVGVGLAALVGAGAASVAVCRRRRAVAG